MPSRPTVVLTREARDNERLAAQLAALGVEVVEIPCVATELVRPESLPRPPFDAVVFTSRRAVLGIFEQNLWIDLVAGGRPLVAAVGPATRAELENRGVEVGLESEAGHGEDLGRLLAGRLRPRSVVLLPCGNLRTGSVERILQDAGHTVKALQVYRNVEPEIPELEEFGVDAVFVASPSAARRLLGKNPWMVRALFFTIGGTTGEAIRGLGVRQVVMLGTESSEWAERMARILKDNRELV